MINHLYHTWIEQIRQLRPGERITRVRTLVWLMLGMFQNKAVHLSKIAVKIPGKAQTLSIERRLRRFVNNEAVDPGEWYAPVALSWLAWAGGSSGIIRLIVDGTHIGFGCQLLMVALAFRRRAVPIRWCWIKTPKGKGHSTRSQQLQLLREVYALLPNNLPVLLVGDCEFGTVAILKQLEAWGWQYALRQKGYTKCQAKKGARWWHMRDLLTKPGQRRWLPNYRLTLVHRYPTHLLAYWQPGEKEPWLLATNIACPTAALRAYRLRMWIEEMFGDWKGHGVNVDQSHLRHPDRLSRLVLAVALLFNWLLALGVTAHKRRTAFWVDRPDRSDLSLFQTGLRLLDRALTNQLPISILLCPS